MHPAAAWIVTGSTGQMVPITFRDLNEKLLSLASVSDAPLKASNA